MTSSALASPLAARGLRPVADLAKDRANCAYEKSRAAARKAGDWNGIVDAAPARAHLAALSGDGVGRRTVGDVAGVSDSVLTEIIAGRKTRIRARTERAILVVTVAAAADRALIDAGPTWVLLDELIADGYSKSAIAAALGYKTRALQLNRNQVTVRNAYEVERLYEQLRTVQARPTLRLLDEIVNEGYPRWLVLQRLGVLATALGQPAPVLTVRNGRIRADAARLVERLHAQLTE